MSKIEFTLTKTVQDRLTATVVCTREELDAAVAEAHPGKTFAELEDWEQYDIAASFAYGGDPDFQYQDGESLGAEITETTITG